jgi:cytochrome c oxidase subunit 4
MSEFHDNYPQYEVMSNHGEEEGKRGRRILWNVFWVMLAITIFELVVGFLAPSKGWSGTWWIKTLFISLTIAKAAAIVLWFMHLGGEVKFFRYAILSPYIVFMLYTIFIVLTEGTYAGSSGRFTRVDPIFRAQQEAFKHGHGHDEAKDMDHSEDVVGGRHSSEEGHH